MPLATAAFNVDDGFLLGLGVQYTKYDGFRKLPYTSAAVDDNPFFLYRCIQDTLQRRVDTRIR
jgi:hypothetical protein